jgi:hypothetical protein
MWRGGFNMKKWFDEYGLIHDKNLDNGYRSGNGSYYTALFSAFCGFGGDIKTMVKDNRISDILEDQFAFHHYIPEYRIRTLRYPSNSALDSHDNILAHLYFGSLTADDLEKTGWYINSTLPSDFTWKQCLADIWRLVKDKGFKPHRNAWHEGDYRAIAKIANRLPSWLRYYGSRKIRYYTAFLLHIFVSYLKPNFKNGIRETNSVSAKIQCYFMLRTTGSKWLIKLFNIKDLCDIYFSEKEHPIRVLLNSEKSD